MVVLGISVFCLLVLFPFFFFVLGALAVSLAGLASKCSLMGGGGKWEKRKYYFMSTSLVGSFKPKGKRKEKKKVIKWSSGCFALLEAEREKCYDGMT